MSGSPRQPAPPPPPHDGSAVVVHFIGTLPPPVNGMNVVSADVLGQLQQSGFAVHIHNTSHPTRRGSAFKLYKALRTAPGLIGLACLRRGEARHALYLAANSGLGLWYDVAAAAVARLRGIPVFVHHHVYAYLAQRNRRMAWLNRLMGARGTHLMLCPEMISRFRWLYGGSATCLHLPNRVPPCPENRPPSSGPNARSSSSVSPLVLGHLSNLTLDKGLDLVLDTFGQLQRLGIACRLILAGPAQGPRERQLIADALRQHGDAIEHRGPVHGRDKTRFFNDIDVMLFPTRYINEAQPLVLLEAFAHGTAVIAYGRGCIRSLVGEQAGVVIDPAADYVSRATRVLENWSRDRSRLAAVRDAARHHSDHLAAEAREAMARFHDALRSAAR